MTFTSKALFALRRSVQARARSLSVVVFGLSVLALSACQRESPRGAAVAAPVAVRTVVVRRGAMQETLDYVGTVHSENEVTVLARMAGKVIEIPVAEGEVAVTGAVLARIAAPDTDVRVSRLGGEVGRAEEESAFLCRQARTDRELVKTKAISPIKADTSQQRCDASRSGVRSARASLRELEIVAAKTVEFAPFAGTVLQWVARPGENTMPGRPLLLFGDAPLELRVQVHEKDIARGIAPGMTALVDLGGDEPVATKVSFVGPVARGLGRAVEVRLAVPPGLPAAPPGSAQAGLRHGTSVDVRFVLKRLADTRSVPRSAVARTAEGSALFVVADDRLRRVVLTPGLEEAGWVSVGGAVSEGSHVVVGNLDVLRDGQPVYAVAQAEHER